jgi:hypothetical protein
VKSISSSDKRSVEEEETHRVVEYPISSSRISWEKFSKREHISLRGTKGHWPLRSEQLKLI